VLKYLGVTVNPQAGTLEICCASDAEAQALADDLSATFSLRDQGKPVVSAYKVTFQAHVMLLTHFLIGQKWRLAMDTRTRLIFDKPEQPGDASPGVAK
jgi:hypothetical protein